MVATSKDCDELYSAKIGNLFQYDFKCFIASFATTVAGFTFCLDTVFGKVAFNTQLFFNAPQVLFFRKKGRKKSQRKETPGFCHTRNASSTNSLPTPIPISCKLCRALHGRKISKANPAGHAWFAQALLFVANLIEHFFKLLCNLMMIQ
jgi:hypothetical protein